MADEGQGMVVIRLVLRLVAGGLRLEAEDELGQRLDIEGRLSRSIATEDHGIALGRASRDTEISLGMIHQLDHQVKGELRALGKLGARRIPGVIDGKATPGKGRLLHF